MRSIKRPDLNSAFNGQTKAARRAVRDAFETQQPLKFPSGWTDFKKDFAEAQQGRCGFCEGQVLGLQFGDVEHFRPKAEISELDESDPDNCGHEEPWGHRIIGRVLKPGRRTPGYWWLAYDWCNYLLSCEICNRKWKGSLFPIAGTRRATGPCKIRIEQPLLLSPFDDFDPAVHFEYGYLGEISGRTEQGRATIRTCGLDRASLRIAREPIARAVHEWLDRLMPDASERELLLLLDNIHKAGAEDSAYCGMVRAIFCDRLKLSWEQLTTVITRLKQRSPHYRRLQSPSDAAPMLADGSERATRRLLTLQA
jgi:hypothetical protein